MLQLQKGKFFGVHNQLFQLNDILLTDTEYTIDHVDWHYHKNPYFTFILNGNILEGNRREKYECAAGTLLYHQWEDPHYNIKRPVYTRGFHIELEDGFFRRHQLDPRLTEGSMQLNDPLIKTVVYKLYAETKVHDRADQLAVDDLLIRVFGLMAPATAPSFSSPAAASSDKSPSSGKSSSPVTSSSPRQPLWVSKVRQALHDLPQDQLSYTLLSGIAGIHPVHLSRDFPKYFHASVGDYLRMVRLEKALSLLAGSQMSATEISYHCGFADQSHFIRTFRRLMKMTPSQYKRAIGGKQDRPS